MTPALGGRFGDDSGRGLCEAGTVEITKGRLQAKLGTDELVDSFIDMSVGMAADESVERVRMR